MKLYIREFIEFYRRCLGGCILGEFKVHQCLPYWKRSLLEKEEFLVSTLISNLAIIPTNFLIMLIKMPY